MSGAERTTKIQNDHADQEIVVDGSQISSKSEANEDQFGSREPIRQNDPTSYEDGKELAVQGAYEPSQYANLPVSGQLKELFKTIQRYTPVLTQLDTRLKAFVPEYIPAIGEVDAFLKMPRPDGQPQTLGLYVLDEPALNQTEREKMDLRIKEINKDYGGGKYSKVHSIESAQKNPKKVMGWINSVAQIQKNKQPPTVNYSKGMPDIDSLMQVWPSQVEQLLSDIPAPSQDIDLSLADYSRVACNLLDIPVHAGINNSVVESLHIMFTLYSAFKENQHFQVNQENESYMEGHR